MPAKRIDTAFVEIVPDLSAMDDVDRQISQALRGVERVAETAAESVEDSMEEAATAVANTFDDAADKVETALDGISTDAKQEFSQIADAAESELRKVGTEANQAGEAVERAFDESARDTENAFDRMRRGINATFTRIKAEATSTAAGIAARFRAATASAGAGLARGGALLGGAAATGIAAGVAGLGLLTGIGLSTAAELEQVQIAFNSLTGSVEAGQATFDSLREFAATTPFEFADITGAAQRFLAFNDSIGLTDAELNNFLGTVGDVVSVTGGGAEALESVARAMGQIASRGTVTLEELNQIGEAVPGFSALDAIASQLGITTAEAMEKISAGELDATTGINALLEGMRQFPGAAGAMEQQSQTLLGVFSTFKDVIGTALSDAFAPAIPAIKDTITQITPILSNAIGIIAPQLGNILNAILPVISQLVEALAPALGVILQVIGNLFTALGPVLVPIAGVISQLVTALAPLAFALGNLIVQALVTLMPLIEALAPVFEALIPPLVQVVNAFLPLLPPILDLLVALTPLIVLIAELAGWIVSLLATKALNPIIKALAFVLQLVADAVQAVVGWFSRLNWGEIGRAIGGAFSRAWEAVKEFFVNLGEFFAGLPGMIGNALAAAGEALLNGLAAIGQFLIELPGKILQGVLFAIGVVIALIYVAVTEVPKRIIEFFIDLPQNLLNIFTMAGEFIIEAWNTFWTNLTTLIETIITGVITFFSELPGRIREFFTNAATNALNAFINMRTNLLNFAANLWNNIKSAMAALPGQVLSFFTTAFQNGVNAVRTAIDNIVGFVRDFPGRISGFAQSVGNSIVGFMKSGINRGIGIINSGIAGVDNALPFVSIPRIPFLAQGGVAFGPALIGEAGIEAAIPLTDQRALGRLRDALGTGGPTVGVVNITINVNGTLTRDQAARVGDAAGNAFIRKLEKRNISTTLRTA